MEEVTILLGVFRHTYVTNRSERSQQYLIIHIRKVTTVLNHIYVTNRPERSQHYLITISAISNKIYISFDLLVPLVFYIVLSGMG